MGFQKENPRLYEAFLAIDALLGAAAGGGAGQSNYARVFSGAGLTIVTATPTILAFNSTVAQSGAMHDDTAQNSRIKILVSGFYNIFGHIEWPSNGVGIRELEVLLSGTTVIAKSKISAPVAGQAENQNIATAYYLAAGDYLELRVNQTSGGNLIIPSTNNYTPHFAVGIGG